MSDMPAAMPLLFTPLRLRGLTLRNRVVVSPMVQYRARDGLANDFHVTHYGKFALGGAALIFTENVAVEARGRTCYADLGLWRDDQIAPLRRVTDYLRSEGAASGIQFGHSGRKGSGQRIIDGGGGPAGPAEIAKGHAPWQTVSPTDEPNGPGWPAPHALTPAEIAGIVEAFATAAKRADAAGFDVGEVHGAHGYLLASFLSAFSNKRNDAYGGDRAGRMRFPLEVTRAVRAVWPSHKPLFFRVSAVDGADGWDMDDTLALAGELKAIGVDVVDCSSGGFVGAGTATTIPRGLGFQVPYAAAVRQLGIASMTVGLILDGQQAEAILQAGSADLIAIGREALRNPYWALHAAEALGCDPGYALWPEETGWWLDKRAKTLAAAGISR